MAEPRLLFILNQAIGDVVLTTGIISAVVARYPGARVTIVCAPNTSALFRPLPGLEEIIEVRRKRFSAHLFEIWPRLLKTRWTRIIDFRRSLLSHALRGPGIRPARPVGKPHKVVEMSSVLARGHPPVSPALLVEPGPPGDVPILALGPGGSGLFKTWPADRFGQAAARLVGPEGALSDAKVLVVGGPMDKAAAATIASHVGPDRVIDLTGADLMVTARAIAPAALFIGNDSGMMHLAAASGAPTLGLFGSTDDTLYAPWGDNTAAVKPEGPDDMLHANKSREDDSVIRRLTVDRVVTAAEALVRRISAETTSSSVR